MTVDRSDPAALRLLVLHGVRVQGFARPPAVAEVVGIDESLAEVVLDSLVADGLATERSGVIDGTSLTPDGKALHLRLLAEELDGAGCRAEVGALYERFLPRNGDVVAVCTAVQLGRSDVGDAVDRLDTIHADAAPVTEELTALLPRFGRYGARLRHALGRVHAGELSFVADPFVPSYHTVWFQLHEDLLCTLGIERGAEPAR